MTRPFIFLAFMLFSSAWAQDNPVQVSIRAFIVAADGTLGESTTAEAGDLIEYQVTATNTDETTLPSESVSIFGPVPEISTYVDGSASETADVTLEYSQDGTTFQTTQADEARAIRWTLEYPLEPGQQVELVYRVTINGGDSSDGAASGSTGSAGAFTQSMFGHLGVIEVACPTALADRATGSAKLTCGQVESNFSLFRQGWDLYAGYEGEVPVIPVPTSA